MKSQITSKRVYHETMVAIYALMDKGEANLNENELRAIEAMSKAVEMYEDEVLCLKPTSEGS